VGRCMVGVACCLVVVACCWLEAGTECEGGDLKGET